MKKHKGRLTIISCGTGPGDLTERHREAVNKAGVLAGGRRLLDWFLPFEGQVVELGKDAAGTAVKLAGMARDHRVAVLASGDALFFGIARRFVDLLPEDSLTILPNITAAQSALSRLRIPWPSARFFSIHGRDMALPWRDVLMASPAVVYGDHKRTPAVIARELVARFPEAADRDAAFAEELGSADRIRRGSLRELAHAECGGLAMLVVFGSGAGGNVDSPPVAIGLEDVAYAHEKNIITHPEVRAVALSKLRVGPGVLWDLGAGSGSVAIESCGLCRELTAYAVEKNPMRCSQIEENARLAGVYGIHVIRGEAQDVMNDLPAPRSIFLGGGGRRADEMAEAAFSFLRPGGRLVAVAVLMETKSRLNHILEDFRIETIEIEVRRAVPVAHSAMLKPDNPVTFFIFGKPLT